MSIFSTRSTKPATTGEDFRIRETITPAKMILWRWRRLIEEASRPIRIHRLPVEIAQ